MKPQSKPLFILNPQVLVDGQKIAEVFVNQIKAGINSQSPLTGNYLDTSATESMVNGIFNYEQFLAKLQSKAPAFTSEGASRFLQAALEHFSFKLDAESLKGLMERGNVSLLLGADPGMALSSYDRAGIKLPSPTTLIERKILSELRTRFGKELRETKENDTFKVDEHKPLSTLQLENKKKSYGQLLHDYVDVASDRKWQSSPHIIETSPGNLMEFRKERDARGKADKFQEAGLELYFVNKNYASMKIPKDIKSYGSLNEIVPIYPKLEGRQPALGMPSKLA